MQGCPFAMVPMETPEVALGFLLLGLVLAATSPAAPADAAFAFFDDAEAGELVLKERGVPVLAYVYKARLPGGVGEKYRREGYLHPLHDLDGAPITADFPFDHRHHRGAWLSWPWMRVGGRQVELWHPSPLRQRFERWTKGEAGNDRAVLAAESSWILDGRRIGREETTFSVHPADETGRVIDVTLVFEALGEPVEVRGQASKGYGGLCVRTAQDLRGGRLLTNEGPLGGDAQGRRFEWAALSNERRGLAVLAHPGNPGSPQPWLVRNSYGGFLNPQWPGTEVATLRPGEPATLRYRIHVCRGPARADVLDALYIGFAERGPGGEP